MVEAMFSSYELQGAPIFDRAGWEFAVFKGLFFNLGSGRVHYAIISTDGFLGLGNDCRPVPIWLLKPNNRRLGFTANVTVDQVKQAPAFVDNQSYDDDPRFWASVAHYYGVTACDAEDKARPALTLLKETGPTAA